MINSTDYRKCLYPYSIWKTKRFLDRSETWTKEQLRAYQVERLQYILRHAYETVPYYRELFDTHKIKPSDIRTAEDMSIIPPLTKETIKERMNDLVSVHYKKYQPLLSYTSGTTGTPMMFYLDKHINIARFAFFWRVWGWTGYRLGQRWANMRGTVFSDGTLYKHSLPQNAIYITSYDLTPENAKIILKKLISFQPRMLRGYPSSIIEFIRLVQDNPDVKKLKLNNIVTDSENLFPHQRRFIERVFGCKVFDLYSQWESICIVADCLEQKKHHQVEYGLLEILDEGNNPVKDGEQGEMVATGFYNLAMPLIRFKLRDLAARSTEVCSCGRNHDIIKDIDGRIEDVVITPDGKRIGRLDVPIKYCTGTDYIQFVQNDPASLRVNIVRNKNFSERDTHILTAKLREMLGNEIRLDYVYVDRIVPTPNGKIRVIVNNYFKAS